MKKSTFIRCFFWLVFLLALFFHASPAVASAPTVTTLSPPDGDTAVSIYENLIMTFDQGVVANSGNIVIHNSDTSVFETIPIGDARVSIVSNVVTINPSALFSPSSGYYINIASGVIEDTSSNAYVGISGTTAWNFTTLAPANTGSCGSPSSQIDLKISSDNYYAVFVGNEDGTRLTFIGQSPDNDWTSAETFSNIAHVVGDYLYVVAWNGGFRRGVLYNFSADGNSQAGNLTTVVSAIGPVKGAGNTRITDVAMQGVLAAAPSWYNPSHYSPNNGSGLWSSTVIPGMGDAEWIWLDDLNNVGGLANPHPGITTYPGADSDNNYVILRTLNTINKSRDDLCSGLAACTYTDPCFNPLDDSVNVPVDSNLTVTFNNAWAYPDTYREFEIRCVSDDSLVASYPYQFDDAEVTGSGTVVFTLDPNTDLPYGTDLYANFDPIKRQSGGAEYGIPNFDKTTWNFTTISGWYSSDWNRRIGIIVNSSQINSSLSYFPVYVDLSDLPASFFSNVKSDGADIRVTKGDGMTALATELVTINTGTNTGHLFFKAPSLTTSCGNQFYIYYGNSSARMINGARDLGSQDVWSESYTAVYHMEQLPGTSDALILDSTNFSNHAVPNGSMVDGDRVAGNTGNALNFDGASQYLSASDSSSLDAATGAGQARTVSYWLNTTDSGSNVVIEKGSDQHFVEQTTVTTGIPQARTNTAAGGKADAITSVTDGSWHYVSHSYDGSTNYIYVDGGSSEDSQVETAPADNNDDLVIAARSGGSFALTGSIDEVRIASTNRSDAWIDAVYDNINTAATFYTVGSEELATATSDPKIQLLYPTWHDYQHPISHPLMIRFNETVNFNAGNINIHRYSDNVLFENIGISSGNITGSGSTTITINPTANFVKGVKYYVLIDYDALRDASSNPFSGIVDKDTWVFTIQGDDSLRKHQIFILDGN